MTVHAEMMVMSCSTATVKTTAARGTKCFLAQEMVSSANLLQNAGPATRGALAADAH